MKKKLIFGVLLGLLSLKLQAQNFISIISDAKSYVFRVIPGRLQVIFEPPCDQYSCLLYSASQKLPFAKEHGYNVPKGTQKIRGTIQSKEPLRLTFEAYEYNEKAVDDFYRGAKKDPKIFTINQPSNTNIDLVINYSKITGYSLKSKTAGVTIK